MSRPKTGIKGLDNYVTDVLDGNIPVPEYVRLAVERHVEDLRRQDDDDFPYYFNKDYAIEFFDYCYYNLQHFDGDLAGDPLELLPWQLFTFGSVFGWLDKETHYRRFRTVIIIIPKKNGKSIMGGAIALYIMECDGERGAQVYSAATNKTQAQKLSYKAAIEFIEMNPEMKKRFKINRSPGNMSIFHYETRSKFEPLTADVRKQDGFKPHVAINDETKDWPDDSLLNVIEDGMILQSQPIQFNITTAGDDKTSLGCDQQQYIQSVLDGEIDDDRTFGYVFGITEEEEDRWDDLEIWRKVNPNFDVMKVEHIEQQITKAKQSGTKKHALLTKHLNQWNDSLSQYFDLEAWQNSATDEIRMEDLRKVPCYLHADLSSTQDLCAVYKLWRVGEDQFFVAGQAYLPEFTVMKKAQGPRAQYQVWNDQGLITLHEGKEVILEKVQKDIEDFDKQYNVKAMGFDPWNAKQMMSHFVKLNKDVIKIGQNARNLSEPMKTISRWTHYAEPKLLHNGDPVLEYCIGNVVAKEDHNQNVFPRKEHPDKKIDAAVSVINLIAMQIAEPLPKNVRRKPRVWVT